MKKEYQHLIHELPPLIDNDSQILILGSFPSVISRKQNFYYANKSNRFWYVLSSIFKVSYPDSNQDKLKLSNDNHIALYDVIEECDIANSSDASIKNVKPSDIAKLINGTSIRLIILNGKKAQELFYKYNFINDVEIINMPSTSSANAQISLLELIDLYTPLLKKK